MSKIEQTLGLRSLEDALRDFKGEGAEASEQFDSDYDPFTLPEDLDRSLALQVDEGTKAVLGERMLAGLDTDRRLDDLHDKLIEHGETLANLAMELDPGKAPRAFEVMNAILKNAMDAVNSKRDHEIKTMRLILDQQKLEQAKNNVDPSLAPMPETIVARMSTADMVRKFRKEMDDAKIADARTEPSDPETK